MTPEAAAALHARAFPPAEAWSESAIALLLALSGSYAHHIPDIGFVMARVAADEAEVLTLAVVPEARGQGCAQRLVATVEDAARQAGYRSLYLYTHDAQALYERLGWRRIEETVDARRPVTIMRRDF